VDATAPAMHAFAPWDTAGRVLEHTTGWVGCKGDAGRVYAMVIQWMQLMSFELVIECVSVWLLVMDPYFLKVSAGGEL